MAAIPVWMWITLMVGLLLILHFSKIRLRRWAWKQLYGDGPAARAVEESEET